MRRCVLKALPAALMLVFAAGQAWASDAEGEYHGYFRSGAGTNSSSGSQACFGLAGAEHYRLGNECNTYGEFEYKKEFAKSSNGASFVGTVMANFYSPFSDPGSAAGKGFNLKEMFVEAKKLDFLNGATAWAGTRYYNRPDVHMLDYQFVNMDGVGGGIDGLPLGSGKFSYAITRVDRTKGDPNAGTGTTDLSATVNDQKNSATRHNFIYDGLQTNTNGSMKFDLVLIQKDTTIANAHSGWGLSIAHTQDKLLGGSNTVLLQYGAGAGAARKIGQIDNVTNDSSVTRTRLIDHLVWQVTPEFSGEAVALTERYKTAAGTQTWTSFGVRPVYAIHENFKLQMELGHDRVTPPTGPTQQLTKLTLAPTIASGKAYWSRPELRLFATYAKWNKAAQDAAAAGSELSSTGVFGSRTNGMSYGIQVETWW